MLTIVLLFRVGVIVNADFDSALQATAFLIPFMILCSGFMVSNDLAHSFLYLFTKPQVKRTSMLGWIRW